ncbi:MAG: TIGR00730 family Rossman fold protein [Verrucomicrobiota bacterium]
MKSVCVYLGSNYGARPEYAEAACRLGQVLAERELTLVYGGSERGLMKELADVVMGNGGKVIGVIPEAIRKVAHKGLMELHVVADMHERKAKMAELASAFVALPGSFGTLDEFFEMLAWAKLGLHRKPCGLLNICGYYDALLEFLDHSVIEEFTHKKHRSMILTSQSPEDLLDQFSRYQAPQISPWIHQNS